MANPIVTGTGRASPQSIYEVLSVTHMSNVRPVGNHRVGTRAYFEDGRVFYYALVGDTTYGSAITRGQVVAQLVPSIAANINIVVTAAAAGDKYPANAAGTTYVKLSPVTTDIPANFYQDGYLYGNDATSEGIIYKIRSHNQADVSASDLLYVELYDRIPSGLAFVGATSEVTLIRNPYDRVGTATDLAEYVVGVAPVSGTASLTPATDVTSPASGTSYFMWLQTWGPCPVLQSDTAVRGANITTTATDGTVAGTAVATSTVIGTQITVGVASEYRAVDLKIRP